MRILLYGFFLLLVSCTTLDKDLKSALSFGQITELNDYSPEIDKQLYIRAYQSPIYIDGCFIETNGVCKYHYYLSVSSYDEYPQINIYPLAQAGELMSVRWLKADAIDTAIIELTFSKYTTTATLNNPNLELDRKTIRVRLTPDNIIEEQIINN